MGSEERLIKVLAGILISKSKLGRGNSRGVIRSDINAGILNLNFSGHNTYQLGKDLEVLIVKGLVIEIPDGNVSRYQLTNRGAKIATNMIDVWNMLRS